MIEPLSVANKSYVETIAILLQEVGFAFIIAYVIAVTVEFRVAEIRNLVLTKGIYEYIYGLNLPRDVFLNVEENIYNTNPQGI